MMLAEEVAPSAKPVWVVSCCPGTNGKKKKMDDCHEDCDGGDDLLKTAAF